MDSQPTPRSELRLPNEFTIPEGVARNIQEGTRGLVERFRSPSRPDLVITLRRSGTLLYDAACKSALTANGVPLPHELSVAVGTKTTDRYTISPDEIKDDPPRFMKWLQTQDQAGQQEIQTLAGELKKLPPGLKNICVVDDCSNEDITLGVTAPLIIQAALREAGLLEAGTGHGELARDPALCERTADIHNPYRELGLGNGITLDRRLISGPPWLDKVRGANIPPSVSLGYTAMPVVMDSVIYELMKGMAQDGTPLTWEHIMEFGRSAAEATNKAMGQSVTSSLPNPVPLLEEKFGRQELMGIHTKLSSALQKVGLKTQV